MLAKLYLTLLDFDENLIVNRVQLLEENCSSLKSDYFENNTKNENYFYKLTIVLVKLKQI